jgi:hypothetical protein
MKPIGAQPIRLETDRFAGSCANHPPADGNGWTSWVERMRVSGASAAFPHDSLSA